MCPEGYYVRALERSDCEELHCLEKAECCKPNSAPEKWGPCYQAQSMGRLLSTWRWIYQSGDWDLLLQVVRIGMKFGSFSIPFLYLEAPHLSRRIGGLLTMKELASASCPTLPWLDSTHGSDGFPIIFLVPSCPFWTCHFFRRFTILLGGSKMFQVVYKLSSCTFWLHFGKERDDTNNLSGIKTAKCCQLPPASMSTQQVAMRWTELPQFCKPKPAGLPAAELSAIAEKSWSNMWQDFSSNRIWIDPNQNTWSQGSFLFLFHWCTIFFILDLHKFPLLALSSFRPSMQWLRSSRDCLNGEMVEVTSS